jgi:hypothetical protein
LYQAVDIVTLKGKESVISLLKETKRMMLMGLRRFTKYTNMPFNLRETITSKLVAENEYLSKQR